jgi:hypothetical protein
MWLLGKPGPFGCALLFGVLGCQHGQSSGAEQHGKLQQAAVTPTLFEIPLPENVVVGGLALVASRELKVNDRVTLVDAQGAPAKLVNTGNGATNIGVDARVGSLWSSGAVTLRERARVDGFVQAAGNYTTQNGVVVTEGVTRNAILTPLDRESFGATFETPCRGAINLNPDATQTLAPDSYGSIRVASRATLKLKSGSYLATSLVVEPQGKLELDDAAGPVVLYLDTGLTFSGSVGSLTGAHPKFLIAYRGTSFVPIEAPFAGSIVAPNAKLNLATVNAPGHAGSFFAKDIEVQPGNRVTFKPFDWQTLLATGSQNRLFGVASALVGTRRVALAGATGSISAQTTSCGQSFRTVAQLTSDMSGRFVASLPNIGSPSLKVCLSAPGFLEKCETLPLGVPPNTGLRLDLAPAQGAIAGSLRDASGALCGKRGGGFATDTLPQATLVSGAGAVSRDVNAYGEYVLPVGAPGTFELIGRCAGASFAQSVSLTSADLQGGRTFDITFQNQAPTLRRVVARHADGSLARTVTAGETLTLQAEADDPDHDALLVRWLDTAGHALPDGAQISYLVSPGVVTQITAQVSDGKGGYDYDQLTLPSSITGNRFTGELLDDAALPLDGTPVEIRGFVGQAQVGAVTTTTDAAGRFAATLPDADRYVVTSLKPGYSAISQVFDRAFTNLSIKQKRVADSLDFDPQQEISVTEPTTGSRLSLPASSLVDRFGIQPSGSVKVYFEDNRDVSSFGSGLVASAAGADAFNPQAVLNVRIVDALDSSRDFVLKPDKSALIELFGVNAEEGLTAIGSDKRRPDWESELTVPIRLEPARPILETGDLDLSVGVGVIKPPACMDINLRRDNVLLPIEVHVWHWSGAERVIDKRLWLTEYGPVRIEGLEAGRPYHVWGYNQSLSVPVPYLTPDLAFDHVISPLPRRLSGSDCVNHPEVLNRPLPQAQSHFLSLYAQWGDVSAKQAFALNYYGDGVLRDKSTLADFRAKNGFDQGQDQHAEFYNRNELGLARALTCTSRGKSLACYLHKFGHPGGPILPAMLDMESGHNAGDTVAMDKTENGPVRFYIYGPDGNLKTTTPFDEEGEKFVPGVCQGCHDNNFVPIDQTTHLYRSDVAFREALEPVRQINSWIYNVPHVTTGGVRSYIARLYPDGVDNAGSLPVEQVPPVYAAKGEESVRIYERGIKPHCQLCHMAQRSTIDWTQYDPTEWGGLDGYPSYAAEVIGHGYMPHAYVPYRNLWLSGAAHHIFDAAQDWEDTVTTFE